MTRKMVVWGEWGVQEFESTTSSSHVIRLYRKKKMKKKFPRKFSLLVAFYCQETSIVCGHFVVVVVGEIKVRFYVSLWEEKLVELCSCFFLYFYLKVR